MKLVLRSVYVLLCTILVFWSVFANATQAVRAQTSPEETPSTNLLSPNAPYQQYLPSILKTSNLDLSFGGYEITQGIQTTSNSVLLVAGRPTVLRLYAMSSSGPISNVRISITARRSGANLPGSPLVIGPGVVSTSYSRSNLSSSFNARLPMEWLSGSISLEVNLDSNNVVPERSEANNRTNINLNFATMPPLSIKAIPITFIDPDSGITYPASSTGYLDDGILRLYPLSTVSVSVRSGITVSCDLDSSACWSAVLDQLTTLKSSDRAPASQVYYGIVPLEDERGRTWFYSGVAGIGWVNSRVALGLADSSDWGINGGEIAAHEIGHNLGRLHAPCGGPSSVDRSYPYANGSIGQYGLNINRMELLTPSIYSDVMGYCDKQWISDYTYNALRAVLAANPPAATAARNSLLVRAALDGDTISQVEPAYSFSGIPDAADTSSEYAVEFVDAGGRTISSYPLHVLETDEPGIHIRRINSLVPLPEESVASYRIVRAGAVLGESRLTSFDAAGLADQPAPAAAGNALNLSWDSTGTPALVRYSADSGQTWTTLAVDLSDGNLSVLREDLPQGNLQIEVILANRIGTPMVLNWENR